MDLFDSLRRALLAGFGAQDKVKEFITELVEKGELSASQGAKLTKEWAEKAAKSNADLTHLMSGGMAKALEKLNIPSRDDMEKLAKEIKSLSAKIRKLEESKGG